MRNKIKLAISCEPMLGEFVFGKSLCRLFTEQQCESHWNGQFDSSREIQKGDFHDFYSVLRCSNTRKQVDARTMDLTGKQGKLNKMIRFSWLADGKHNKVPQGIG